MDLTNNGVNAEVFAALLRGLGKVYGLRNLSGEGYSRLLSLCEQAERVYRDDDERGVALIEYEPEDHADLHEQNSANAVPPSAHGYVSREDDGEVDGL